MGSVPPYAFTFTAPQMIVNLGDTAADAQVLTVPIYVGGLITALACERLADRYKTRWKFIAFLYTFALIGFIGLLSVPECLPGLI
jgi:cyanate permease